MAKKPITYYQGGGSDFPDYKQGADGKYYQLGRDGKMMAPDYSYREDMKKYAEQGAPIIPQGPGVTSYANQQGQPRQAPAPQQPYGYAPQGYAAQQAYPQGYQQYAPPAQQPYAYPQGAYPQGYAQPQAYAAPQPGQAYYYPTPGGPPVAYVPAPAYAPQQGYAPQQAYAPPAAAPVPETVLPAPRKIPLPSAAGDNDESYDLGSGARMDEVTGVAPPIQRLPNTPPAIPARRNLPDINSIYRSGAGDADDAYQAPKGMIGGNDADDYHQLYNNF